MFSLEVLNEFSSEMAVVSKNLQSTSVDLVGCTKRIIEFEAFIEDKMADRKRFSVIYENAFISIYIPK